MIQATFAGPGVGSPPRPPGWYSSLAMYVSNPNSGGVSDSSWGGVGRVGGEGTKNEDEEERGEGEKNEGEGEKNEGEGEKNKGEGEKNKGEGEKNKGDKIIFTKVM